MAQAVAQLARILAPGIVGSMPFLTAYHATTPAAAKAIKKHGFKPSEHGRLGKGVYFTKHKFAAKKIAKNHVKGKAVVIKTKVYVKKIKKLGKANPGHSNKEHFKGKAIAGKHPGCWGMPKGFTELCVHNPKRIKV